MTVSLSDLAKRSSDVLGRQNTCRHLVEKRLKDIMIGPVGKAHLSARLLQPHVSRVRCVQPSAFNVPSGIVLTVNGAGRALMYRMSDTFGSLVPVLRLVKQRY